MRVTPYLLIASFSLPLIALADDAIFTGGPEDVEWMDLPAGYVWKEFRGVDSVPGVILKSDGLTITFDLLLMAGEAISREDSAGYLWYKERFSESGELMRVAEVSEGRLVVTFPSYSSNFFCDFECKSDVSEILGLLKTFDIVRYGQHLSETRPTNRSNKPLETTTANAAASQF